MKRAFISGPYRADTTHGIVENIRRAEAYAIKYWNEGYAVFCPHKNTALFDGVAPDDVWLKGDLEFLLVCHVIVMIPGWRNSVGSRLELEYAKKHGLEIVYDDLTKTS